MGMFYYLSVDAILNVICRWINTSIVESVQTLLKMRGLKEKWKE